MDAVSLLGSTMGLGFVSGLNLYAAVLTVGLGLRLGLIHPYPAISHLEVLTNPYVLATAGVLYLVEFFADKIPWVDSVWDTFHTLIRPIGAAALGATAVGSIDPATKSVMMLVGGGVAFSSHSTKAGTRVAVNHSPEPFSNIFLSLVEDGFAIVGTWLAVTHPYVMFTLVAIFLVIFAWLSPKIFRLLRVELIAGVALVKKLFSPKQTYALRATNGSTFPVGVANDSGSGSSNKALLEEMPKKHAEYWQNNFRPQATEFCIRCVAGKGIKGLRNSIGYLQHTNEGLFFLTRRFFRFRSHKIDLNNIEDVRFKRGLLLDRISWQADKKQQTLLFFKHRAELGQEVLNALQKPKAREGYSAY
jgi:hypothetical protein